MRNFIQYFTKHLLVRYIISGGTSASVNLASFSLFLYVFHIHYLVSGVISFLIAFGISLVLQKFWTFQDHSTENIHLQGLRYLANSLFGLLINTSVLYISVHSFGLWEFTGVIVAGITTALCTFPISQKYVFNLQPK